MKRYTQEELEGKFVIAYDTICDGNQCLMGGEEGDADYAPLLFDSEDEALRKIFDDNLSMLISHLEDGMLQKFNDGVTREMIEDMENVFETSDVAQMRKFMEEYPECNDSGEWVEPAETFIVNRKAIFTTKGIVIEGKKLH